MGCKRWNRIRDRVEYIALLGFVLLVWMTPLKVNLMIADGLGWFIFSILRIRRRVVIENLGKSFPEMSRKERLRISRRAYNHMARTVFESIRFPIMKRESFLSLCRFEGLDYLDQAIKKGRGGVMVAGHFGNWELMGSAIAQLGYPISCLVQEQRNKLVDQVMNAHRKHMGMKIISLGLAVRGVFRALRNNEFVAFLADQDARERGIFIDFLGRKSSTHQGPAFFVLKKGSPIIFGSDIRLPKGKHRIVFEYLEFDYLQGFTSENIREVTEAYSKLLERKIREYPDHWFWMHRRWKTRPPKVK